MSPSLPAAKGSAELVRFEEVSYSAGTSEARREVLVGVNLSLRRGEVLSLVGSNGAGKSTICALAAGNLRPSTGRLVRSGSLAVGFVPQRLAVNSLMPMASFRFLGFRSASLPAALLGLLGELSFPRAKLSLDMSLLSGGERQKLVMARALWLGRDLLILDEPSSYLDVSSVARMYGAIAAAKQRGVSILLVSHDVHSVMYATDYVLCIDKRVLCAGRPAEVNAQIGELLGGLDRPFFHDHALHGGHGGGSSLSGGISGEVSGEASGGGS